MNTFNRLTFLVMMPFALVTFSHCSSAQKLQDEAPFKINEAYYQSWVSGVRGGGAGVNVFLDMDSIPQNVTLDSIYFRGKGTKFEVKEGNKTLLIARFRSVANQKQDIIMSNEPQAEYGNQVPKIPQKIPFRLKDDECVISYTEGKTTKYFKIDKLIKRRPQAFP